MTNMRDLITQEGAAVVREAERRSLFHSTYDSTNLKASIQHLCHDAKRRR